MLAGVPRFTVRTYRLASESARMASSSAAEEMWVEGRPSMFALTGSFMDEAAKHVAAASLASVAGVANCPGRMLLPAGDD